MLVRSTGNVFWWPFSRDPVEKHQTLGCPLAQPASCNAERKAPENGMKRCLLENVWDCLHASIQRWTSAPSFTEGVIFFIFIYLYIYFSPSPLQPYYITPVLLKFFHTVTWADLLTKYRNHTFKTSWQMHVSGTCYCSIIVFINRLHRQGRLISQMPHYQMTETQ